MFREAQFSKLTAGAENISLISNTEYLMHWVLLAQATQDANADRLSLPLVKISFRNKGLTNSLLLISKEKNVQI